MDQAFQRGQRFDIEIVSLNHQGQGVGRIEDLVVFVDGGVPGDKAKIELIEVKKNYAVARMVELLRASERRVEPFCGLYPRCGGCQLQHVDYAAQLEHKRQVVADALERIGGLRGVDVLPTLGMAEPRHYRNKAQYPVGRTAGKRAEAGLVIGFYRTGTHEIVPTEYCYLQSRLNNRAAQRFFALLRAAGLPAYNERTGEGLLRHILIRTNAADTEALALVVTNGDAVRQGGVAPTEVTATLQAVGKKLMAEVPEVVGVLWNVNPRRTNVILGPRTTVLAGQGRMVDVLAVEGWGELKFAVSVTSFFQVNPAQTSVLYKTALDYAQVQVDDDVIDAYCGVGTISLFAAVRARHVWGIEEAAAAIRDAEENQRLNSIPNATFIADKVENVLPRLAADGIRPRIVILDPPRAGCDPAVLAAIVQMAPERIVYISCNPSTLARDLARLTAGDDDSGESAANHGYRVLSVQPVDMFPQTSHVECVVSLNRGRSC